MPTDSSLTLPCLLVGTSSAIDEIAGAYLEEARGNADGRRAIHDALAQALHAERMVSHGCSWSS